MFATYAAAGEASADDPCGGEGGSGYVIVVNVTSAGALVPDSISCHAPG